MDIQSEGFLSDIEINEKSLGKDITIKEKIQIRVNKKSQIIKMKIKRIEKKFNEKY